MTRAAVLCDGAALIESTDGFDRVLELRHTGPKANVAINLESPVHRLRNSLEPIGSDLLKIAAYAFCADQQVSRGGKADLYGRDWGRDFQMVVPVSNPNLWDSCVDSLCDTLRFVSGDKWTFRFTQAEPASHEVPLAFDEKEAMQNPDCVCLLSGGLDSLCATIDKLQEGRRPLLVGHSPAFNVRNRRSALIGSVRRIVAPWPMPQISAAISRQDGADPKEDSQRTRSFLYASLGAVFAHRLEVEHVYLSDNGVVSLNLPINAQLTGTLASRSTHPKFIRLFNMLLGEIYESPPSVSNPLWARTRSECLDVLNTPTLRSLIGETVSCVHTRLQVAGKTHCGVCSQCLDRRFATLAAGLEADDPIEKYMQDIFIDPIPEGTARTMVESFHRFALAVERLTEEALFEQYPELYECITPGSRHQRQEAQALVDLLHRHARTVLKVTESQIEAAKHQLARRELPSDCLISLLGGGAYSFRVEPQLSSNGAAATWHSQDYRSIFWEGEWRSLSVNRARVVQLLDEVKTPVSQDHILEELDIQSRSLYQVFRGCWAWATLVISPSKGLYALNAPEIH